jgi:hypothetical protein
LNVYGDVNCRKRENVSGAVFSPLRKEPSEMLLGAQELVVCVCVCAWKRRLFSRFQEPGALVYGESICARRVIFLSRSRTGPGRRLKGSEGIPKKLLPLLSAQSISFPSLLFRHFPLVPREKRSGTDVLRQRRPKHIRTTVHGERLLKEKRRIRRKKR